MSRFRGIIAAGVGAGTVVLGVWFCAASPVIMVTLRQNMPTEASQTQTPNTNRLIYEKSPYLLLHAHNPVDWYPWGEEAFAKARSEQKPIFLSIGYSTCHWCHVMERESFSDTTIAETMNRYFVNIKVDREERPDVDRIYMTFVQATTGSGGWPMSVFLTPDLKPFFGGTYFPPDDRFGHPGFRSLLLHIENSWANDREKVRRSAAEMTDYLRQAVAAVAVEKGELDEAVLRQAFEEIKKNYDPLRGGFGQAPKFPRPVVFNFLLRYYARSRQKEALEMTLHALRAMARGGIHDHIGGGFHRYSTDAAWHVPHFEKMLYDQAQLAVSYVEAYQITRDQFFAATARDILDYVLRDMRDTAGGFYSAEDADSQISPENAAHGEGAFYVWGAEELEKILGPDVALFEFYYGVEPHGNVSPGQDPHGEFEAKNILFQAHSLAESAARFGLTESDTSAKLAGMRRKVFEARALRARPPLDDKILTAWNGLLISALARASQALGEPRYRAAAEADAAFLKSKLYDSSPDGRLKRRYRSGESAIDGFLDDYAYLIQGLLDLYETSFDVQWLSWAVALEEKQDELFWDSRQGGYFSTGGGDASILMQMREDYDGAEPAANSIAAMNLLRLAEMTGRQTWRERADKIFSVAARRLRGSPEAVPQLAAALDFKLTPTKQIIIAGDPVAGDTRSLLRLVYDRYLPNKILLVADGGEGQKRLAGWLPFVATMTRQQGKATGYVCENYTCKLPTTDAREVERLLEGKS